MSCERDIEKLNENIEKYQELEQDLVRTLKEKESGLLEDWKYLELRAKEIQEDVNFHAKLIARDVVRLKMKGCEMKKL